MTPPESAARSCGSPTPLAQSPTATKHGHGAPTPNTSASRWSRTGSGPDGRMPDTDGRARLLLTALPAGLAAVASSPAGEAPRDRRGRLKARFVDLIPADDMLSLELDPSVSDMQ